jgi:hypothetical protein
VLCCVLCYVCCVVLCLLCCVVSDVLSLDRLAVESAR